MSLTASLAAAVAQLTAPVAVALEGPDQFASFLGELGYDVELDTDDFAVVTQLLPVVADLTELVEIAESLGDGGDAPGELTAAAISLSRSVLDAIDTLSGVTGATVTSMVEPLDDPATWRQIATALPGHLLVTWLRLEHPLLFASLVLGGVVVARDEDATPPAPAFELDWSALGPLLSNPLEHMSDTYGWGGSFQHQRLLLALGRFLQAAGIPSASLPPPDALDDAWWDGGAPPEVQALRATVLEETSGPLAPLTLGVLALPVPDRGTGAAASRLLLTHEVVTRTGGPTFPLGDGWELRLEGAATATGGLGVVLGPDGTELAGPSAAVGAAFSVSARPESPWRLLGGTSGTRLELRDASLEAAVRGPANNPELVLSGSTEELALVVAASEGDAFVASLLGAVPIEVPVGLDLAWSSQHGLTLGGDVGFTITIPLGRKVGPVTIDQLQAALSGGTEGIAATVTVTGAALLGPLTVVADGVGVAVLLSSASDGSGNLGAADLAIAFKPPDGIGVGIDIGVVRGGGYLDIDAEAGSYDGVIDIELLGIGISAVVIIDTKLPDVSGWSMFFALFLDLPSLQLGFGFTLLGVGGVAGINRAIDVDALGSAVRSGSLDTILFPQNPIADAPIIIDEFRSIFPPADGSYVFGPVVKIGWGTPTIIEARLGVVIQLPDPVVVVVLGSISSVLPTEDLELVALRLDVAGVVDATAGTLSIDASLHDSHVVGFALAGDMALRASFGATQSFLMSLGGFHPRFDAPSGFPNLRRLSFGINAGSILRIDFQSYFALTSNSVQFGAEFSLDAEVMGFGVSGSSGFDALVQFTPFVVMASVDFEVSIKAAGIDLMGVTLHASVEGPNRWHVIGTATFEILKLEKNIRVDELIGAKEHEQPVYAPNLLTDLITALNADDAWQVVGGSDSAVTFAATAAAPPETQGTGQVAATPDSVVEVRQMLVPLGLDLEQFGTAPVGPETVFDLQSTGQESEPLFDWFPPGNYLELTEQDKLEGPSFELMRSGLQLGKGAPAAGPVVTVETGYVSFILDPELPEQDTPSRFTAVLLAEAGVSLAASEFSASQEFVVATASPSYAVVDADGMAVQREATWAEAFSASRSDGLHVERELAQVAS